MIEEAMGAKTLFSLAEFERLPDEGAQHELDEGELITLPPPKWPHTSAADNVSRSLQEYVVPRKLGRVVLEAGFLLSVDPPIVRQPDVAFIRRDRIPESNSYQYINGAPDLAIEIVSPTDSMMDVDRKVEQYLAAGSALVWVLMPKYCRIRIYRADGTSAVRHAGELLDAPELFPGWSVAVDEVFV